MKALSISVVAFVCLALTAEPAQARLAPGDNGNTLSIGTVQIDGSSGITTVPPAAAPYADIIADLSAEHGVPAELVHAVIQVESGYREHALSPRGAMGLMQLTPETARRFEVADPFDPKQNIDGGIRFLKTLLARFPLRLALAAYNAGEATVRRFRGIPPYAETRDYVARILRLVRR